GVAWRLVGSPRRRLYPFRLCAFDCPRSPLRVAGRQRLFERWNQLALPFCAGGRLLAWLSGLEHHGVGGRDRLCQRASNAAGSSALVRGSAALDNLPCPSVLVMHRCPELDL